MKKIISLLLCFALVISLAGCGKSDNPDESGKNNTATLDIAADLQAGKIPELPISLGCNVNDARNTLSALEEIPEDAEPEEGYTYYTTKISGDTVRLGCEGNFYYYNESKSSSGISAMATFTKAYGFTIGLEMLSDITGAIVQKGTVYSPTADDLYFVFGEPDLSKYQAVYYTSGDMRLDFIFYDSYLSAVVISNTKLWNSSSAK